MDSVLATGVPRGLKEVWWLHPFKLGLFFLVPLYTVIFLMPKLLGSEAVNLKFIVYFSWTYYWIGLGFLLVLVNAALIGTAIAPVRGPCPTSPPVFNPYYLDALALLTVVAYLVWYRQLFVHPSALLAVLSGKPGASQAVRSTVRTIGGVTTLTQLGCAYVVLYLSQAWGARVPFASKRYAFYFCAIVGLALFRVFVWSERLALIEVMVPTAVMYVVYRVPRTTLTRLVVPALPLIGIGALFVFFGATEYLRSWLAHYQYERTGFLGFVGKRIAGYYYTALNNGAGMLTIYDWPSWQLNNVLEWLYKFPLLGQILSYVLGFRPGQSFLERYADPEYNNLSGIFMVIMDLGLIGGSVYAALMGGMAGYLWRSLMQSRGGGIFYPIFFLGLLEIFRVLYLSEPRALPTLVALLIAYVIFRQRPPKVAEA